MNVGDWRVDARSLLSFFKDVFLKINFLLTESGFERIVYVKLFDDAVKEGLNPLVLIKSSFLVLTFELVIDGSFRYWVLFCEFFNEDRLINVFALTGYYYSYDILLNFKLRYLIILSFSRAFFGL